MDAYTIIFYILAAMTIISAVIVAFTNKIIYAAFALLFTLFGFATLYVYLSADFIAVSQVLIYVGGILLLILFGVMLTTKIYDVSIQSERNPILPSIITGLGATGVIGYVIFNTPWNAVVEKEFTSIAPDIGNAIMGKFLLPFEVASILLLGALIGSVLLARSEEKK
jgi:NADH:ubiquinone oxidoreductase subunit 6 (subunit J)